MGRAGERAARGSVIRLKGDDQVRHREPATAGRNGRLVEVHAGADSHRWQWPILLLCFFLSGIAGLVYQVAWTRQFALVFGSSELAVVAVLAAFLGGLGVGAAVAAYLSPRTSRPVLVYALLELAIAVSALVVPWGIRLTEHLYVSLFGMQEALPQIGDTATMLFHLAATFAILIVPTGCMGATLPLLARFAVRRRSEIGSATGLLYAVNTTGAVFGAPLAGFILLPALGLANTILVAVGLNLLAFSVSLAIARPIIVKRVPAADPDHTSESKTRDRILVLLIFLSGAVSLVYEVFWTRLLGHLLGGSLTAFSTMLASFLAGIALGSALASRLAHSTKRGVAGFAFAQLGIAACTAASYAVVVHFFADPSFGWGSDRSLAADALLAASALLPAAICIGATFPFAVRILAQNARDAAPASARVYGWSTLGSIVGAIAAGLLLLPTLGFSGTLGAAVAVNLLLALAAALLLEFRLPRLAAAAVIALAVLAFTPPSTPWSVLRSGPLHAGHQAGQVVHYGVGRNATVLLTELEGVWKLSSNGLPEGSIEAPGIPMGRYQVTRWLGSLAVFLRPETRTMMFIGLGAGEALETVPSTVKSIEVVELESEIVRANRAVASERRRDPLSDPRIRLVINDARAALLLSRKPFDAIVSQPSHPWTPGSAHLYTREFFKLAKSRLGPDGVFVQWIGLAFIDEDLLRAVLATLTDVFPHVHAYRPPTGAALLFVASESPFAVNPWSQQASAAASDLPELGIARQEDFAAAHVLDASGSRALGAGAPLIRDDQNLLESRSARLFGHALGRDLAEGVLAPWDPLIADSVPPLDRAALVRRLISIGHGARARRLAEATHDPLERQVALALIATAGGRTQLAGQLLNDVLNRDPLSAEGRALSLRQRHSRISGGATPDPRLLPLTEAEAAVVNAWRLGAQGEWSRIEALEPTLATVEPGAPLFREATRLRVQWRLSTGDQSHTRDAVRIIDPLLARGRTPEDLLLRARASSVGGTQRSTLATLSDLAHLIVRHPQREIWARPARVLLEQLPEDPSVATWRSSIAVLLTTPGG